MFERSPICLACSRPPDSREREKTRCTKNEWGLGSWRGAYRRPCLALTQAPTHFSHAIDHIRILSIGLELACNGG